MSTPSEATTVAKESKAGKRFWILPLILLLVTVGGFLFGRAQVTARYRPSPLVVDASKLDLGTAWSQEGLLWSIPITNTGPKDIASLAIEASCSCAAIEPRRLDLRAGETATISLVIDLRPSRLTEAELPERRFEVLIQAIEAQPSTLRSPQWILRGRVRNPMYAQERQLQFDGAERVYRGSASPPKIVSVKAHYPLKQVEALVVPPLASASISPLSDDRKSFDISVIPRSDLPPGSFEARLEIHAELVGEEVIPPFIIPITGTVVPDVYSLPDNLQLGAVLIGSRRTDVVVLASRRGEAFTSKPSRDQPRGVTLSRDSSQTASEHKYHLEIVADIIGSQSFAARVIVSSNDEPPYEVLFPINYFAYQPDQMP